MQIAGFTLLPRRQVLVRGYVGLLGAVGVGVALWTQSIILALFGGLMLGAYLSQSFPIWKEATSDHDQRYLDHLLAAPKPMIYYYWTIPVVVVGFVMLAVAAKLAG